MYFSVNGENAIALKYFDLRTSVVPWSLRGMILILRGCDVMPNLLEIHYKFCKLKYIR
jgi:hypothetical protein